jgi:hypothetical protein
VTASLVLPSNWSPARRHRPRSGAWTLPSGQRGPRYGRLAAGGTSGSAIQSDAAAIATPLPRSRTLPPRGRAATIAECGTSTGGVDSLDRHRARRQRPVGSAQLLNVELQGHARKIDDVPGLTCCELGPSVMRLMGCMSQDRSNRCAPLCEAPPGPLLVIGVLRPWWRVLRCTDRPSEILDDLPALSDRIIPLAEFEMADRSPKTIRYPLESDGDRDSFQRTLDNVERRMT